jgi:hypothetical protein
MFYVAPKVSTKPLEQMFRVRVIKMLVEEELLAEELACKLLKWKHSGFSVHNGKPVKRNDTDGLKRVAQYIICNPFSEEKMTYNEENGTIIYRSRMHAKTKRNFEVFSAEDFIAAITQHIPEKGFQMVRYYGWYSNRARGERAKKQTEESETDTPADIRVIDVSDYQPALYRVRRTLVHGPRRLPSKKWRELIKQVWEVDPFDCPQCGAEMKFVALIDDNEVIEKILRHLNLWPENSLPVRAPPPSMIQDCIYEPFFDGYSDYDLPALPSGRGQAGEALAG